MAQAHLSSLDMSSVDREEPSSGEEEEEHAKDSQQTASAIGGSYRTVFHIMSFFYLILAFVPRIDVAYTFEIPFLPDLREESKPLRDQCAPLDCLTGSADLSRHHGDKEEAKEREEGKGEWQKNKAPMDTEC